MLKPNEHYLSSFVQVSIQVKGLTHSQKTDFSIRKWDKFKKITPRISTGRTILI
jgi:hypothetical protein